VPFVRHPLPCGLSSPQRKTCGTVLRSALGIAYPILAVSLALMSAGCAYSYVDSNNIRHIIGFVDVSLPAAPTEASGPMPTAVSVTSLGVHVYSGTVNGSGLVLGYGKETVLVMPNNACVDITAPGLCAETADLRKQP
jgi:hypothetical protein